MLRSRGSVKSIGIPRVGQRMIAHVKRALAMVVLVLAGCEEGPAVAELAAEACTPGITGIAEYDALYALGDGGRPVIHAISREVRDAHAAELRARVERAAPVDPSALAPAARVALQNDLWGLWQRLTHDGDHAPLRAGLAALIRALALPADRIPGRGAIAITTAAARTIDPRDGWREVGTELPVLGHERAFELRRVFHVVLGRDARALTSQLVALDDHGRAHASDVPGDLEVLAPAVGQPSSARLFELDRRALRCRDRDALVETDHVAVVPGLGASSFFLELDPPAPVASMPCARCHDDGEVDSLPDASIPPAPRIRVLLDQATELAAPIFD